jgi:hypothetical protein
MSGMASMGKVVSEYVPHPIKPITNNPTMNLFFIEKRMIRSIIRK